MTPFERMLDSTLYVAADRARRERRPMAVERCPVAWTVRDAAEPTPSGYERITLVQPDEHTEEARMGIAKRIYTARSEGKPVSAAVLAFFGQEPASKMPLLTGDTLPAAIVSKQVADSFAPRIEPTPTPAPEATMSTPTTKVEKIDGRNWAREIQDQLLSLPSVQRFIEEHGDLAQLGQGLPCARDARQFIYPNLFERFQKLIEESTEEAYTPAPAPVPEAAPTPPPIVEDEKPSEANAECPHCDRSGQPCALCDGSGSVSARLADQYHKQAATIASSPVPEQAKSDSSEQLVEIRLPAKCPKCDREWVGASGIPAPSLDHQKCAYCDVDLIPHPDYPDTVFAKRMTVSDQIIAVMTKTSSVPFEAVKLDKLVEIANEVKVPTKRELSLRRSDRPVREPRVFSQDPEQQHPTVPPYVHKPLAHSLDEIKRYRDEIERGRELGRKFGGGRRYVDDVRTNMGEALRRFLPTVRDFVRRAPECGVNPYAYLRYVWSGQDLVDEQARIQAALDAPVLRADPEIVEVPEPVSEPEVTEPSPPRTTVVNVQRHERQDLMADPNFLYVGPAVPHVGWDASDWANPWKEGSAYGGGKLSAYGAVDAYRTALRAGAEEKWQRLRLRLPELKGKRLGCLCCDWDGTDKPSRTCHAIVLAEVADQGFPRLTEAETIHALISGERESAVEAVTPLATQALEVPDPVPQTGHSLTPTPRRSGRRKQAAAGQGSLFD